MTKCDIICKSNNAFFPFQYKFQEFKRKEKTTSNEVKQEEENNIKLIPR